MISVEPFLTAYDPNDLPGGSVDPLGFAKGYLTLADKILPDLTTVTDQPRYFSLLCLGCSLASEVEARSRVEQYRERLIRVLRLERLWALANVLASETDSDLGTNGIRGILSVKDFRLQSPNRSAARPDQFRMLSRQFTYGMMGIYGSVAEQLYLLADRKVLDLTQACGVALADAFREETGIPAAIVEAVRSNASVQFEVLANWGKQAHVAAPVCDGERERFRDMLHQNPVRSRMAEVLSRVRYASDGEKELDRLSRARAALTDSGPNADLWESLNVILAYESAYRWALLGFHRLLWLCRRQGPLDAKTVRNDEVLELVREELPGATEALSAAVDGARTQHVRDCIHRLDDVRQFLSAASAVPSPESLVEVLLQRHGDVQHGKFDRGQRKMPWVQKQDGKPTLMMTNIIDLRRGVSSLDDILPHPYRLNSADGLISASESAR